MAGLAGAVTERSTIVAANALAAQQWEMYFAAEPIRAGAVAWETPPVKSYAAWLDELWLEHADARGPALTASQSFALWRRVVAESAESSELIGHAGAAEWAAAAWAVLHRWQIDPVAQRAAATDVDYRAFLGWCRRYRARLDDHRWIDRAEVEAALTAHGSARGRLVVADPPEPYPARTALLARLAAHGAAHSEISAPAVAGSRHTARLADAADELRAALAWAKRQLDRQSYRTRRRRRAHDGPAARRSRTPDRGRARLAALLDRRPAARRRSGHRCRVRCPDVGDRQRAVRDLRSLASQLLSSRCRARSNSRAHGWTQSCAPSCARNCRFERPIVAA